MKQSLKIGLLLFVLFVIGFGTNFFQIRSKDLQFTYELRGRYKSSPDGKTYLVIEDSNGGECGHLYVDKAVWTYNLKQKGEIETGTHNIECGSWVEITVKEGTTFYFDYWGP